MGFQIDIVVTFGALQHVSEDSSKSTVRNRNCQNCKINNNLGLNNRFELKYNFFSVTFSGIIYYIIQVYILT